MAKVCENTKLEILSYYNRSIVASELKGKIVVTVEVWS